MNRAFVHGLLTVLVAVLGAGVTARSHVPRVAPAAAAAAHQITIAGLAGDSATPPRNCDPANPAFGDFDFSDVQHASADGVAAQLITGVLTNRCSQAAKGVMVEAAAFSGGTGLTIVGSPLDSDILAPGESAPFMFMMDAATPSIDQLVFQILPYTQPADAIPDLRVTSLQPNSTADGIRYDYSVTNHGAANATLPRIAARLVGPGCDNPFTLEPVNSSNQVLPGETITGELAVPGDCGGSPEVFAGSDGPLDSSTPAGWSVQGARLTYTSDGVMHLLAMLCNNNGANFYLFPAVRLQFTGSQTTTADVYDTNYYPSQTCRPLIASFPGAPAGLSFSSLVAVDTGEGFEAASAQTAAALQPAFAAANEKFNQEFEAWEYDVARAVTTIEQIEKENNDTDNNDHWFPIVRTFEGDFQVATGGILSLFYQSAVPLPDLRESAASDQGDLLGLLYNPDDVSFGASDQILLAAGTDAAGNVTAGIAMTDLPTVAPHTWAMLDIPLDGPDVVRVPGTSTSFGTLAATRPAVAPTGP